MKNKSEKTKLPTGEKNTQTESPKEIPMRRIVIETNGADIKLVEANVAGIIELVAILNAVIGFVSKKPQ